jgi:hypothetical protein
MHPRARDCLRGASIGAARRGRGMRKTVEFSCVSASNRLIFKIFIYLRLLFLLCVVNLRITVCVTNVRILPQPTTLPEFVRPTVRGGAGRLPSLLATNTEPTKWNVQPAA